MIRIKATGHKQILKRLEQFERVGARQALKKGLDKTAFDVRDNLRKGMPNQLDRPKPFSVRGIVTKKATAAKLTAYVFVLKIQEAYLRFQVFGGSTVKRKVVPSSSWPKDQYGNLRKGATKQSRVLATTIGFGKRAYFKIRGGTGNRTLELIGFIPFVRRYSKRWHFFKLGTIAARRVAEFRIYKEFFRSGLIR